MMKLMLIKHHSYKEIKILDKHLKTLINPTICIFYFFKIFFPFFSLFFTRKNTINILSLHLKNKIHGFRFFQKHKAVYNSCQSLCKHLFSRGLKTCFSIPYSNQMITPLPEATANICMLLKGNKSDLKTNQLQLESSKAGLKSKQTKQRFARPRLTEE